MLNQNSNKPTKYIFVSGGVISGLGKGIIMSSLSLLLKQAGYTVSPMKADMYLNIDAGTMNPLEHGESFVTEDGKETDLDLGHYERYLNIDLHANNYMTMGQIYSEVLAKERALEYHGKCVEGHIHIPEAIIEHIERNNKDAEVVLIEIGGTVGEYQNILFYEAVRRFKQKHKNDTILVHVVYLPVPKFLGEMKSKPAQASIYELYKLGVSPDFVICRSEDAVDEKRRGSISFNTGVPADHIISSPDVDTVYKVPLVLQAQNFEMLVQQDLGLSEPKKSDLSSWQAKIDKINALTDSVTIGIAGKYFVSGNFSLEDSYVCVIEAIKHACWSLNLKPNIKWFDVENLDKEEVAKCDGIIVPQGWGSRGVEGKIETVKLAREKQIPYLGLCFGMQMAAIEFGRDVLGFEKANSAEVDEKTKYPVIHVMPNQEELLKKHQYGGTIRLGAWPCLVQKGSLLEECYKKWGGSRLDENNIAMERHRHRYEFNNEYKVQYEKAGMVFSGTSPDGEIVETMELPKDKHPFFLGTQYHPEFKSRFESPHPIFVGFIEASRKNQKRA